MRQGLLERLEHGLEGLEVLLEGMSTERIRRRSAAGQWSAHEHLAHLGRYHEITLERLEKISASQEVPQLARYRAEEDPEASSWFEMPTGGVVMELRELRRVLYERCLRLSDADLERPAVHPLFGAMPLKKWLEFFLDHEGHHLYLAVLRLAEAAQPLEQKQS